MKNEAGYKTMNYDPNYNIHSKKIGESKYSKMPSAYL